MKVIKLANLLAFALAISLGPVGCKTRTPPTIKFDEQGRPIAGSGADQTAGNAGKLDTDSGVNKSADTTGIAMGIGHPGWGEVRETLQADTIHFRGVQLRGDCCIPAMREPGGADDEGEHENRGAKR